MCLFSAGEMLSVAEHFLEQQMHPTVVISAYRKALDDMISTLKKIRYWDQRLVSRGGPEDGGVLRWWRKARHIARAFHCRPVCEAERGGQQRDKGQ